MPTSYIPVRNGKLFAIPLDNLEKKLKVRQIYLLKKTATSFILSDGDAHLLGFPSGPAVSYFEQNGRYEVSYILQVLETIFEVEMVDDQDERYFELINEDE